MERSQNVLASLELQLENYQFKFTSYGIKV
jgi:hypothetical protein